MITNYTISNFRNFRKVGSSFRLKPVTFLTGANGAGKSSLVKSICLLKSYFDSIHSDFRKTGVFNPALSFLDFTDDRLKLPGFEKSLNRYEEDDRIIFAFSTPTSLTESNVMLEYAFRKNPTTFSKGELDSIRFFLDGEVFFHATNVNDKLKIESLVLGDKILSQFIIFACTGCFHKYVFEENYQMAMLGNPLEDDEFSEIIKKKMQWAIKWCDGNNPAFSAFFNDNQIKEKYKYLQPNKYESSLKKALDTNILFWFPVFDQLIGLTKKECVDYLQQLSCPIALSEMRSVNFDSVKGRVIEDFINSSCESFVDYFRALENKRLLSYHSCGPNVILGGREYDFIKEDLWKTVMVKCDNFGIMDSDSSSAISEFSNAYHLLSWISWPVNNESDEYISRSRYVGDDPLELEYSSHHFLYDALCDYIKILIKELLSSSMFDRFYYIGNSFSDIKRLYAYSESSPFVRAIHAYDSLKGKIKQIKETKPDVNLLSPGVFINKWMESLSIGKGINIIEDEEGLGFKIEIIKTNGKVISLSDEGHGLTQLISILINIENEILADSLSRYVNGQRHMNSDSELLRGNNSPILAIEEPEVSLHPSLQSKLALVFEDAALNYGIQFIIETHSEYLIRKTQSIISNYETDEEFMNNPFVVYYMNKYGSSYDMEYTQSGRFENSFGSGFFDEAGNSSIEIIKREKFLRH